MIWKICIHTYIHTCIHSNWGKCIQSNVIYQATVTTATTTETYVGLATNFKERYRNHQSSFRRSNRRNETELSKYIWTLQDSKKPFQIKWKVSKKCKPYSNISKKCNLCLSEKFIIIYKNELCNLNRRKELASSCPHSFVIAHSSGDFTYIQSYNVARASKRHWGQGLTKCNNDFYKGMMLHDTYLRAKKWARNPNLLVVITHASHVCSQHWFGLPLRMYGMHTTHFDHGRLDLLPLIWSRVFWPSVKWNLRKVKRWSKSILTFDCYRPHSVTFGYF